MRIPRVAGSFLPSSPCRHGGRTVSSSWISPTSNVLDASGSGAPRTVSEDPANSAGSFLLIVRTGRIVTTHDSQPPKMAVTRTSTARYSDVPAYSEVLQQPRGHLTVIVHAIPHVAMRRGPYLHPSRFTEGALRMASEDSHFLNTARISSSLRRRFPPRFIGPSTRGLARLPRRKDADLTEQVQ